MGSISNIDDLSADEQLVFGGLVRLMVRTDGSFSEEEEGAINAIGDAVGGHARFWSMISRSAQAFPDEAAIRGEVVKVERPAVRAFILNSLRTIAASDETDAEEDELLTWVDQQWR